MGLLLIGILLGVLAILFFTEHEASPRRLKDRTVLWIFLGMVIPLVVMVVEHILTMPVFGLLSILGIAVFGFGVLIRFVARRTLGKFFMYEVAVKKRHKLVRSGVYQYIRHPLYTGILLLWFGAAITLQSIVGFVLVFLTLVPALWHRMRVEEIMLTKAFGNKYQAYMQTTKRLIPFVY